MHLRALFSSVFIRFKNTPSAASDFSQMEKTWVDYTNDEYDEISGCGVGCPSVSRRLSEESSE